MSNKDIFLNDVKSGENTKISLMVMRVMFRDTTKVVAILADKSGDIKATIPCKKGDVTEGRVILVEGKKDGNFDVRKYEFIDEYEIESSLEKIKESDILIAQFETAEEMTLKAFKRAKEFGKVTILNPAPAKEINEELLKVTDIIVPNETEAEVLTGVTVETLEDANRAGQIFLEKGVKFVIITLGDKGAAVIGKDFCELVPGYKVKAIDTTAAGDSFIGGLSSKLDFKNINKETLIKAVNFGNKVSSISVQRKGAQPSIPYLKEVEEIYEED